MVISLSCAALLYSLLSAEPIPGKLRWVIITRAEYTKLTEECSGFVASMEKKKEEE